MFLKKNENGRSMIEMLGVLGIMAVITVLSVKAYTMAMKNIKINKLKNDIILIYQTVESRRGVGPDYSFLDIEDIDDEHLEQRENTIRYMVNSGAFKNVESAFGGCIKGDCDNFFGYGFKEYIDKQTGISYLTVKVGFPSTKQGWRDCIYVDRVLDLDIISDHWESTSCKPSYTGSNYGYLGVSLIFERKK